MTPAVAQLTEATTLMGSKFRTEAAAIAALFRAVNKVRADTAASHPPPPGHTAGGPAGGTAPAAALPPRGAAPAPAPPPATVQPGFSTGAAANTEPSDSVLQRLEGFPLFPQISTAAIARDTDQLALLLQPPEPRTATNHVCSPGAAAETAASMSLRAQPTWVFTGDASKKEPDGPGISGFGGWWWLYGTTTVFYFLGRWRADEVTHLDITSLEKKTGDMALAFLRELLQALPGSIPPRVDVILLGDNHSDVDRMANSYKGHATASRWLIHERTTRLAATPGWRVMGYHVNRRHNYAADALSNGDVSSAVQTLRAHFGPAGERLQAVDLGPVPGHARDTTALLGGQFRPEQELVGGDRRQNSVHGHDTQHGRTRTPQTVHQDVSLEQRGGTAPGPRAGATDARPKQPGRSRNHCLRAPLDALLKRWARRPHPDASVP
eukprot:SAG31_NODE_5281_length_2633_cov_3.575375_1_plen_437_part_00